jgi:hypothetical protein
MVKQRKFFKSLESQKIQRDLSNERRKRQRRNKRNRLLRSLDKEMKNQAAVDSIAFQFASQARKDRVG